MTDKRGVEFPEGFEHSLGTLEKVIASLAVELDIDSFDRIEMAFRIAQLRAFWGDQVTKISQLEQQILEIQGNAAIRFAEAEDRWHKAEEELKVTKKELDYLCEKFRESVITHRAEIELIRSKEIK